MRTMVLAATAAAAILASAGPVAAQGTDQTGADHNAVCIIGVTDILRMADEQEDRLSDAMKSAIEGFRNALYFHAGVLHARYGDAAFRPVIMAAAKEYATIPRKGLAKFVSECTQDSNPVLAALADALKETD